MRSIRVRGGPLRWSWVFVLAGVALGPAGCVRPQYDTQMGAANLLAADAFDATTADLLQHSVALRNQLMASRSYQVEAKAEAVHAAATQLAAASQPSPQEVAGLVAQSAEVVLKVQELDAARTQDQQARSMLAEIERKAKAASQVIRTLGQRSIAIGQQEQQLLQSLGIQQGGK